VARRPGRLGVKRSCVQNSLGKLRDAGVVYAKKRSGGGYILARAASEIKIGQVIRAIDGPLAPHRLCQPHRL
jgi:DNA-binding IscR family transcriptional regulator